MSILDDFRLAPILDDPSLFGNAAIDLFPLDLPPLQDSSVTRPGLQEPGNVNPQTPLRSRFDEQLDAPRSAETRRGKQAGKNTAPIAEVLNYEAPDESGRAFQAQSGWEWSPTKRRKADDDRNRPEWLHLLEPPVVATQGPPQQQSLPPLLQGLIEPVPDAGLFPRIQQHGSDPWPKPPGESAAFVPNEDAVLEKSYLRRDSPEQKQPDAATQIPKPSHRRHKSNSEKTPKKQDATAIRQRDKKSKPTKAQQDPKKNMWSAEETQDLERGVAKHGKGQWQKILLDADFNFDRRTAIDLKDKWRVRDRNKITKSPTKPDHVSSDEQPKGDTSKKSSMRFSNILRSSTPTSSHEQSNPAPSKRKPNTTPRRNPYAKEEDLAIERGFEKYGAKWAWILADNDILHKRSPRDLRDRVRHKWPEKYKALGLKGAKQQQRTGPNLADSVKETEIGGHVEPAAACIDPSVTWKLPGLV